MRKQNKNLMQKMDSVCAKAKNMALYLLWSILIIPLFAHQSIIAQQQKEFKPRFERFQLPGGKLGNNVNSIIQDSIGFVWFGSHGGLHQYDGHRIKTFKHDPRDTNSLSVSYIEWLLLDSKGRLWIGTYGGGMNLFDYRDETFQRFVHSEEENSLSHNYVHMMAEDHQGHIWIATSEGLNQFDPEKKVFTNFRHDADDPQSLSSDFVKCVYIDQEGTVWAGTGNPFDLQSNDGGLNRFDPDRKFFTRYMQDSSSDDQLVNHKIRAIYEDNRGNFWVGSAGFHIFQMDRNAGTFELFTTDLANSNRLQPPVLNSGVQDPSGHITFIKEDMQGRIWVGAWRGGLNVFDPEHQTLHHFEPFDHELNSASNVFMWDMCQSRDGTVWIATAGGGGEVLKVNQQNDFLHFTDLAQELPTKYGPSDFFEAKDGSLWLTLESGGIARFAQDPEKSQALPLNTFELASDHIHAITADDNEDFYLVMGNQGGAQPLLLDHVEMSNGEVHHYRLESNFPYTSSWANTYRQMVFDNSGRIWITSLGAGLISFDTQDQSFTQYRHQTDNESSLTNDMIFSIYQDQSGLIWLGGGGAPVVNYFCFLNSFDPSTGVFERYELAKSLNTSYILGITEDDEGDIWFAFFEQGLGRLDPNSGEITYYNQSNSNLPQDDIRAIAKDGDGYFWLTTEHDLLRFDPRTLICSSYKSTEKLTQSFRIQSSYVSTNSQMYFATENGFVSFSQNEVLSTQSANLPTIVFTSLSQNPDGSGLQNMIDKPIWESDKIILNYNQNSFLLRFSNFSFSDPTSSRYEYMLDPYHEQWRVTDNQGQASFTKVPPGQYLMKVKSAISDGLWSTVKTLEIRIDPPWWRTWWAYLLYALAFGGLLQLIRYEELKKQKKKLDQQEEKLKYEQNINEQLRRVDRLKDQFLANTSHELRTPLQGIIGLSESMYTRMNDQKSKEDLTMIVSAGKRLSALVNDILDYSRLKNNDLKLHLIPVDMKGLSDMVVAISMPLLKGRDIEMVNLIDEHIEPVRGDENRLYQIMHNLVDNARKFTQSGHIHITAEKLDEYLEICVEDTGIGIPLDKQKSIFKAFEQVDGSISRQYSGAGLGLSVTKKLVELHGGKIWVKSKEGEGSRFFFTIPLSSEEVDRSTLKQNDQVITLLQSANTNSIPTVQPQLQNIRSDAQRIKILIIDDEPINHQVFNNHLSHELYDLTHCLNGKDGLEKLETQGPFDLVLLDIMMPRMSGYEVCQKIRAKYSPSELPILMISAKNQVDDLVEGLNTGASDYIVKPFSKDEFLARLKTHLNLHLINTATSKFVPNEFLNSLGYSNVTEVILGDYALKHVTVCVSDIRDYTSLAEKMSPEDNFGFISAYARRMGPIIQKNNGFINQFLGDGIISIYPGSPSDGIRAAIQMQQLLNEYNKQRHSKNQQSIHTGIGLDTGPLIMGIIGSDTRNDAAVISDTVNTASRMEGLTKYFGTRILASESTLNLLPDSSRFNYRFLGNVLPKGKSNVLKIYDFIDYLEEDARQVRIENIGIFQEGLNKYYDRSFSEAVSLFKSVLETDPKDYAASLYLSRAARFLAEGVEEDWNGVENIVMK